MVEIQNITNCIDLQTKDGFEFDLVQVWVREYGAKPHLEPVHSELRSVSLDEIFSPAEEQVRAVFGYVAFGEDANPEILKRVSDPHRCHPCYEPGQFINWRFNSFSKPSWMPLANHLRVWLRKGVIASVFANTVKRTQVVSGAVILP